MKQTQTKPSNQTANTKTSTPPPLNNKPKTFRCFQDHLVLAVPHNTEYCEKWADTLDEINELEAIQACCSAEWGHKPVLHCRGLWCWAMAICPVLSLKSCRHSCLLCGLSMGLSALCHQMVNFCCEWVWWKENLVPPQHLHNHLIDKPVPRRSEGLEGKVFTKAGEMGLQYNLRHRSHFGKQMFP